MPARKRRQNSQVSPLLVGTVLLVVGILENKDGWVGLVPSERASVRILLTQNNEWFLKRKRATAAVGIATPRQLLLLIVY